jgi:hypothetical protein
MVTKTIAALVALIFLMTTTSEGFGLGPLGKGNLKGTVSDFAENVSGEAYLNTFMDTDSVFNINDEESESLVSEKDMVSDFAKELTYSKFLTMQV